MRRLETWLNNVEIQSTLFQLNAKKLDELLCRFYVQLRKTDGSNYEPDSLRVMLAALDRHFKDNGSTFSLLRDKEFEKSRKVLNGKAIELREGGMGKRKNKADSLSDEDEEALWSSGTLGDDNPYCFEPYHMVHFKPTIWDQWSPGTYSNEFRRF